MRATKTLCCCGNEIGLGLSFFFLQTCKTVVVQSKIGGSKEENENNVTGEKMIDRERMKKRRLGRKQGETESPSLHSLCMSVLSARLRCALLNDHSNDFSGIPFLWCVVIYYEVLEYYLSWHHSTSPSWMTDNGKAGIGQRISIGSREQASLI